MPNLVPFTSARELQFFIYALSLFVLAVITGFYGAMSNQRSSIVLSMSYEQLEHYFGRSNARRVLEEAKKLKRSASLAFMAVPVLVIASLFLILLGAILRNS